MQKYKYAYFRDFKNPRRVLALAYHLDGDQIHWGWAMNRPPRKGNPGDQFVKKTARQLATARLDNSLTRNEGEWIPRQVLRAIYNNRGEYPCSVHRVARDYFESHTYLENLLGGREWPVAL